MYPIASSTVRINCPSPAVFDYVADLENFCDWFPGALTITAQDDLAVATIGKRYVETVAVPLRGRRQVLLRVVDVQAPRRLVTEGDLPVLLPRMQIDVCDAGNDACEVRWSMVSRNENVLARRFVLPPARRLMQRRAEAGLCHLKRHLEGTAGFVA